MISYTKRNVNTIIFVLTTIVYILFCIVSKNVIAFNVQRNQKYTNELQSSYEIKESSIVKKDSAQMSNTSDNGKYLEEINNWEISIPVISLKAPIQNGTTKEIMDEYVGHFETTSFWDGNVGLAAHNRGYPVNYFANIKSLNLGDKIFYKYNGKQKEYMVTTITVITDEDWSYLQNTNDNRITLITCVENEPAYRRCIQATQIN